MEITSLDNQQVKRVRALHNKKYRDEYGEFFIEGPKLLQEAIKYRQNIKNVFYCPDLIEKDFEVEAIKVSKEIMAKMTDTSTPQGIVAVCDIPRYELNKREKLLFLDRVQDPGNVGTIIRTADAFGFDAVLLSAGCADVYSPKVVRATMGSLFHLPIIQDVSVERLKSFGNKIYSSSLETDNFLDDVKLDVPFILVIGNEGKGISDEVKGVTDSFVKIDMAGNAESLNASIAAGILMYEFASRTSKKGL